MNKLFPIFKDSFSRSLRDFNFISEIAKKSTQRAVFYLFTLLFLIYFIQILFIAIYLGFNSEKLTGKILESTESLSRQFPDNLVISVYDGNLKTNKESPIYIKLPDTSGFGDYVNLIAIDDKGKIKNFTSYKSIFVITKDSIAYAADVKTDSQYNLVPIEDIGLPPEIRKKDFLNFLSNIDSKVKWVQSNIFILLIFAVLIIPFVIAFTMTVWYGIYIVFLSIGVYFISILFKLNLKYLGVLKMGFYGATLPLLLSYLLYFFGFEIQNIFLSSFLLWMIIALSKINKPNPDSKN